MKVPGRERVALLALIGWLPKAGRAPAVGLVLLVAAAGVLPLAAIIVVGEVVGLIPSAVEGGLGSAAGHRLVMGVGWLGVLYALQQGLAPIRDAAAASLDSRLLAAGRSATVQAALGPAGIAHLDDPHLADEIAQSREPDPATMWAQAPATSWSQLAQRRLQALLAAGILARFTLWAPLVVWASWSLTRRWFRREADTVARSLEGRQEDLRRADYLHRLLIESRNAKEIRVFGLRQWIGQRHERSWSSGTQEVWKHRRANRAAYLTSMAVLLMAHALVAQALARAASSGTINLTALTVYAGALLRLEGFAPAGDPEWGLRAGLRWLRRAFGLEKHLDNVSVPMGGALGADGLPTRVIRFESVSFRYPSSPASVLEDFDLSMPKGRSLAVVGLNGAGKTTFVKLLCRLYDPDAGRIMVDAVDLRSLDPACWRERVAVIFQDFTRFRMSLADNIGFGRLNNGDLDAAVEQAGAADLARRTGWGTVLSPDHRNGVELSGGEWQRVALARAFAAVRAGASVLVLDEPTASLDVRAEAEPFRLFLALTQGLTVVLISHRFSTVRLADHICVVDGGRVVEEGSHDELMRLGGRYHGMFRSQAERFAGEGVP